MFEKKQFVWHPAAHLFAADQLIRRPSQGSVGFQAIPSRPATRALAQLAKAIEGECSFCLYEGTMPSLTTPPSDSFLTLSGGTSGAPKTILRQQRSWLDSFAINADIFNLTQEDCAAVLGALCHSLSLYGVMEALNLGMDIHVLDAQAPARHRQHIAAHHITVLYLTPSQLRLLATGRTAKPLPAVRLIICGGGTMSAETAQLARKLCPNAQIRVFYGASETSFISMSDDQTPEGSVGKPYPGVEVKLLAQDGRQTTATGEIWVRSPYLFDRYAVGSSKDTRWKEGFVTVGEIGHIDPQGNIWLKGRISRMVTIADRNVFPEEIEACINAVDGIENCAVIALPDALRGHRLIAVLGGRPDDVLTQEARRKCVETFGPLIAPKTILSRDKLPVLPSGKVDIGALDNWAKAFI